MSSKLTSKDIPRGYERETIDKTNFDYFQDS
jgi:hypothetical protein